MRDTNVLKNEIEKVIFKTFQSMRTIYAVHIDNFTGANSLSVTGEKTFRLKYPLKHSQVNEKTVDIRISEQELKQVFIYHLQNETNYWFSVETPTVNKYRFKDTLIPKVDPDNQSALVDLSVYYDDESEKPCAHIEFKCGNPKKAAFQKDILKLYKENVEMGFFVLILPSDNVGTWRSIIVKFLEGIKDLIGDDDDVKSDSHKVYVYILSLRTKECYVSDEDLKTVDGFIYKVL